MSGRGEREELHGQAVREGPVSPALREVSAVREARRGDTAGAAAAEVPEAGLRGRAVAQREAHGDRLPGHEAAGVPDLSMEGHDGGGSLDEAVDGEAWDAAAWKLLAEDAKRRGVKWATYLREAGILGGHDIKRIQQYEVASLNESITEGDL